MKQILISEIKIGKRFRKNLGNVEKLCNSIEEVDLLHPVVIDEENRLIAGQRRLEACKKLGWEQIPFTRISIDDARIGEFHENSIRKDFTVEEVVQIKKYIEKTRIGHRPKKEGKLPTLPRGNTRDIVSEITNYSPRQINKMEEIVETVQKKPKYRHLLEDIDNNKKSVNTVHTLVTREKRNRPKARMPKQISDVIHADVPIGFDDKGGRGAAENHYTTMTPEELGKLKIPIAENAVCFFWMSPSIAYSEIPVEYKVGTKSLMINIPIYKYILNKWGFTEIKGAYAWDKEKIGVGTWMRNQHEDCFIGIKGKMPAPAEAFSSIIREKRTQHSKKPEEIFKRIEKMYPERNYLGLFERKARKGWRVFGNEIKRRSD